MTKKKRVEAEVGTNPPGSDLVVGDPIYRRDEHVQRLEGELRLTREHLQATIEKLESANEELKSSNAEYQSINEELRAGETRQRLLLAELQHRVKNILAVVRSLASRTARSATSLEEFTAHLEGRISALARSQSVLARRTEGGVDLEELIRDELTAHGFQDGETLMLDGPPIRLRPKAAETIGLAVHELTTNAVKYGALSAPSGRLAVTWRINEGGSGPRARLEWKESGVAALVTQPARKGFGRELIERGLPYELGASTALEFGNGGVRCVVELPLNDRVVIAGMDGPEETGAA